MKLKLRRMFLKMFERYMNKNILRGYVSALVLDEEAKKKLIYILSSLVLVTHFNLNLQLLYLNTDKSIYYHC